MTALHYEGSHADDGAGLQVWHGASCHCVHIRAGQVLLTFAREEFVTFTQEIVACYCEGVVHSNTLDQTSADTSQVILTSDANH